MNESMTPEQLEAIASLLRDTGPQTTSECEKWLNKFLTATPSLVEMKEKVKKLSTINSPVLIVGETGTGKELIARALHGDRQGKFVAINCSSMPEQLLESELFGHKRGAFTGAIEDKIGLIATAREGTLFLDEIGDFPEVLQPKLLRVIQEGVYRGVGWNKESEVQCRFIAATWQPNKIRRDLLYRLSTFKIELIPFNDRLLTDVIMLIKQTAPLLTEEQVNRILMHLARGTIPGNAREIQSLALQMHTFNALND